MTDDLETVLDAAFRQGITLMHGCREGQCSACKSFLIEGDVQMDRYSTFALADYESEEGYILLCKTHVYSDADPGDGVKVSGIQYQHRPPRRCHRADQGGVDVGAVGQFVAIAADDQQRVVDRQSESHRGAEVGPFSLVRGM